MIDLDHAGLDRVLPATPGPADWDDVMTRFGVHRHRRRRRLVVLAATALVAILGTASAIGSVREFFLDRGFIGLPPSGATPSSPERTELVLGLYGRSATFGGRLTRVWVYADGRIVWDREGQTPRGANELTSGLLEQRLTPEGVEMLRSAVISSGMFEHDAFFRSDEFDPGLFWMRFDARNGDRLVRLYAFHGWGFDRSAGRTFDGTLIPEGEVQTPTASQRRALVRVDALIADPASRLPASAWEERQVKAYVASRYAVCWGHRPEQHPGQEERAIAPSRVLTLLPTAVEGLLRRHGSVPEAGTPPAACSVMPTEEARAVAQALDDAGLEERSLGEGRGSETLARLVYRSKAPNGRPGNVYVYFEPTLPHGEWVCSPCG